MMKLKMKKRHMATILPVLMILLMFAGFSTQPVSAAAGTAGSFNSSTVSQAIEDAWVTLKFDGLTASAEFIVVQATVGNNTFSTASGQTTQEITIKVDASGSLTFNLYGYNTSSGVASGSILATWLLTVTPSSDFNADQITGAIPLFIGLLVGGIILAMAVKRAY